MALMLSLQQSFSDGPDDQENMDPSGSPTSASVPASCGPCLAEAAPANTSAGGDFSSPAAAEDDDTPVGRNIMPADSPHLQAPQKNNKRRAELSEAAAQPVQMKLPKSAKLNDVAEDVAAVFREAVSRRWGDYLVQMGERELAAACVDARRAIGEPMSSAERAACLVACAAALSGVPSSPTGLQLQRQVTHLCQPDSAAQLEALLRPAVGAAAAAASAAAAAPPGSLLHLEEDVDPRDFCEPSESELGEVLRAAKAAAQQESAARSEAAAKALLCQPAEAPAAAGAGEEKKEEQKEKPKKRNRCHQCRKKVGLLGFDCRCGGVYCGAHRGTREHSCSYEEQRKVEVKVSHSSSCTCIPHHGLISFGRFSDILLVVQGAD